MNAYSFQKPEATSVTSTVNDVFFQQRHFLQPTMEISVVSANDENYAYLEVAGIYIYKKYTL